MFATGIGLGGHRAGLRSHRARRRVRGRAHLGGHFNPAVTIGCRDGQALRVEGRDAYIITQTIAAIAAAGVLWLVAINQRGQTKDALAAGGLGSNGYGDHSPALFNVGAGLVTEIVFTAIFVLVILGITDRRAPKGFAAIAIGLTLTMIHLATISVTGTSVNPARSTGPAVVALFGGESWPMSSSGCSGSLPSSAPSLRSGRPTASSAAGRRCRQRGRTGRPRLSRRRRRRRFAFGSTRSQKAIVRRPPRGGGHAAAWLGHGVARVDPTLPNSAEYRPPDPVAEGTEALLDVGRHRIAPMMITATRQPRARRHAGHQPGTTVRAEDGRRPAPVRDPCDGQGFLAQVDSVAGAEVDRDGRS